VTVGKPWAFWGSKWLIGPIEQGGSLIEPIIDPPTLGRLERQGAAWPTAPAGKRALDLCLATMALVLLAPLLVLIAAAIRIDSPGAALYTQIRAGRAGRRFRIYKFRTMVANADELLGDVLHLNLHAAEHGDSRLYKIPSDPRVTRVGAFLRRYSLDEFPQLVNVVKGDMSLVGPRPLMLMEDQNVQGPARIRASVRPGITGPWQVRGRNDLSFAEMMALDRDYVVNHCLTGDLWLLVQTIPAMFRAQRAC
jgi:lipopolysaccharide/colanic/teichoic acid biosynthesis glycosyltransferase